MKRLIALTMIVCMLIACGTTKSVTTTDHNVITERTVEIEYVTKHDTIQVTKYQVDSVQQSLLQNQLDSALLACETKDAKLAYLAEQLQAGKLNSELKSAHTELADAYAQIRNNYLWLKLEQKPYEAIVDYVAKNTTITDKTKDTQVTTRVIETIKHKPFYDDIWFWLTVVLLLLICIRMLLRHFLRI